MSRLLFLFFLSFAILLPTGFSSAADKSLPTRPIRVLFISPEKGRPNDAVPLLMEKFGRDAIYFDSLQAADALSPEMLGHYDVVLMDSAQKLTDDQTKVLGGLAPGRAAIIKKDLEAEAKKADFAKTIRGEILAAAGDKAVKEWEAFVAQRELEKREPHPMVANYEKRPQPVTFQHPFDVKGSMERTQVPADMKLEFFAGHPDIAKPIAFAWDERGRLWIAETRDYRAGGAHKNELRDHERGRIYRVVQEKATKPAITSLKGASHAQLVAALNNDTQFWRLKAHTTDLSKGTDDRWFDVGSIH